jgi:hypothetical protein
VDLPWIEDRLRVGVGGAADGGARDGRDGKQGGPKKRCPAVPPELRSAAT